MMFRELSIVDYLLIACLVVAVIAAGVSEARRHRDVAAARNERDRYLVEYLDLKVSVSRMCTTRSECVHQSRLVEGLEAELQRRRRGEPG